MKTTLTERLVNAVIRVLIRLLCVVDTRELEKVPTRGPGILASNHTSNFEGPVYYTLLRGRKTTALGKQELWGNPVTRFLMQIWRIIPINRSGPDRRALKRALHRLERGEFLGIAPEGTRSLTGVLQKGRPGAAMLAVEAGVPIFPMVQWGLRDVPSNAKRLRRTRVFFGVGRPFRVRKLAGSRVSAKELRIITDEIMYQLALQLPEEYRGYYRDLAAMTTDYLDFV